jgi:hypothetical protein
MAKKFDNQVLNTMIMGVVEDTFKQMCKVSFSSEPVVVEKDIIEYDGRMRLFPMEKFNAPAYVGVVNYYLSKKHLDAKDAVGTFVIYIKEDMIERFVKAFGRPASEAEDEAVCLDVVGELCNIIGGGFKDELLNLDFINLTLSLPFKYKNAVPDGVPFDYNLFKKQELSFSFWKEKCVVVEMCLGDVPIKGH